MDVPRIALRRSFMLAMILACMLGSGTAQAWQQESQKPPPASASSSQTKHRRHVTVSEEEGPQPELAKAEDLIQKRDYAQAESVLQKLVASDSENYVAWFDLGFVENALGKPQDSIAAYRKSVAAKPNVFESNLNLGLQLAKTGQGDAEKFLRAATQLTPTSHVAEGQARAWLSLAHLLEPTEPEESIAAYQHAADLLPKDLEPHLSAGLLLEKQNKFSDAEQEYRKALAIDPASSEATIGLANIYMRGRRFPDAEAELRKIVSAHPDQAGAHVQLGRVLAAQEKNDEAIAELQEALKRTPGDTALQRDLADLYNSAGKNEQAEAAFRTLVSTHPDDAELRHSLGVSLLKQKKFADAQNEFLQTVKLRPGFAAAYGDLAFAASSNNDYGLTLKALDERAKLQPDIPITYFLRASAYDHLKNVKQAVANYRLFLQGADGKYPDQEWQAKHRLIALEPKK
jgi:tetratricopeptide (TPR) repeat protein